MDLERLRRVDPGYKEENSGLKFSKTELIHILIAVLVLSLAFSIILRGSYLDSNQVMNYLKIFAISVLLVTCSFLIHELGHKYVAQMYGAWSEFRMFPAGLLMSLIFAFVGFLFAAPGAVYIKGNVTQEQYGKISLAGPLTNFIFAAIATGLCLVMSDALLVSILAQLAWLNAFLGIFNMIPIPPLDGSKVIKWSIPAFIIFAVIGVIELIVIRTIIF